MVPLVIIDLDGTLLDSFADIRRGVAHALGQLGFATDGGGAGEDVLALCDRGVPLETYYERAVGRDPAGPEERERFFRFVDAYRRYYTAHQDHTRVYPGVPETLTGLRERGVRLAVGTSKRTDMARSVLAKAGLDGYFDLIQGSDEVAKKPDPALLHLIARHAGIGIEEAVMVGDTGADVGAAKAAGCRAIAVTYGGWSRVELAALGPEHLIDDIRELLAIL